MSNPFNGPSRCTTRSQRHMPDLLRVRRLRLPVKVGATAAERSQHQNVLFDVEVESDLSRAAASDDLGDTIDYAEVLDRIERIATGSEFALLERLAGEIVRELSELPGVVRVTVEAGKERPPVNQDVGSVSIRIEGTP